MKLCLRCNQYCSDAEEVCPNDQGALEPVGKDPLIGALIDDRYVIDSVIGKGSSGIVYKASRLMMGGEVAVKVIHSYLGADSASLDRLLRELKAAERLRHPHIITVWDSGTTDDGQPYLVMDYLEGITLSQLITQKGALPPKRVLNVMRQVTEALGHAHEQGLIHRDMKPENVVLEESEIRGDYVKVLDFGIADTPQESAQRAKFNKPKTVAGSPAYMSPEQCQGFELDYRSDLYSMAVIVFEMFTGRRPFLAHDLMKLMYMTVTEPPPKMGAVRKDLSFPESVEAVLAKALSKLPDERQASVREFWKELETACAGLEFGKSDRVKLAPREQQNVLDHEILPSERLMDEDKPKRPQFEAGPEDMPELFMPPPPPPKSGAPASGAPSGGASAGGSPPSPSKPSGGLPPAGTRPATGMSGLVNKQQAKPASAASPSSSANTLPAQSSTSTPAVKPLQPARVGPGGPKAAPGAPTRPGDPSRSNQQLPSAGAAPARPGAPPPPGGAKPVGGPPPAPGAKPPGPPGSGPPGAKGAAPPLPTAKPGMPQKPPVPPKDANKPPVESAQDGEVLPDKTMNRLSALVKRPTVSMPMPTDFDSKPEAPVASSSAPEPKPAEARPPSVYSYVPPKEEKIAPSPEKAESKSAGPQGSKPGAGPAKPGGPAGAKPASGAQGASGAKGAPAGAKVGPAGAKPGGPGPAGAKPAGPGPSGAKPGTAPAGAKTAGPSGTKPGGAAGSGSGSGSAPGSGSSSGTGVGSGTGTGSSVGAKPGAAPASAAKNSSSPAAASQKSSAPGKTEPAPKRDLLAGPERTAPMFDYGDEITPALARAGATWADSTDSLDGNLGEIPERRMSNLDWEGEIEALKTGSVAPINLDSGEPLHPAASGGAWPAGVTPQGVPGQPGYPNMNQSWPPGVMQPMPGQPMMPPYDQSMSYPPGMMPPYMQPPGYPPPGYPMPPNQDVSGAYPMMPNYPPPGGDVSGSYQIPGYGMPPGQPYSFGAPGMPMMPPQGMPPGMMPQGMPPGMVPQGMPPGMVPQNMPPQGMPPGPGPGHMPPFMNPSPPGNDGALGRAIADDMRAEFGDSSTTILMIQDELYEDFVDEEPEFLSPAKENEPEAKQVDEETNKVDSKKEEPKKEAAKKEPTSSRTGLGALLGGDEIVTNGLDFSKGNDADDAVARENALAAKSAAEAEELGDSLLALMDATEKDRSGGFETEKSEKPDFGKSEPASKTDFSGKTDFSNKSDKSDSPKSEDKPKRRDDEEDDAPPKPTGLAGLLGALAADDDEETAEPAEDAGSGNAFADAVASSASVSSLTEKKDKSSSAFGQLLAAVKDEDEDFELPAPESAEDESEGRENTLPKDAIQQALEDLLPEPSAKGSIQKSTEMKNPFEADDDLLGTPGIKSGAEEEPAAAPPKEKEVMGGAAARLAAAMNEDDDEEDSSPSFGSDLSGSVVSGAVAQNPSTSTSDALSRLLEAASKAPSKASDSSSMSEIDKMAARVNKPQAKVSRKLATQKSADAVNEPQPFGGFGGGGGGFGSGTGGGAAFGGASAGASEGRTGGTGTNSSYSQDAVNARIAELNRKLEAQSSTGRQNIELPPAPAPDPSVIGDSVNRRDVVNRIMEEAAMRHQYGADYQPPPQSMGAKPTQSGSDFSPSDLEKVNSNRLANMADAEQRRKKTSRSRNAGPRVPAGPIVAVVLLIVLGGAGFMFKDQLMPMINGIMAGAPSQKAEDNNEKLISQVNDLMAKGKLNEASKLLESEEDANGLPAELSEKLDVIYLGIAKYKKNNGAANEAIEKLKLIPAESSHYAEAQKLIKQYQKGGKKSSSKRKRR